MKICSLLPSATEIVFALGLGDQLVAVTHECDYPPEAKEKPVITSSVLEHSGNSSRHIHESIKKLIHEGSSIYHLNHQLLQELNPDLILTQELCDVCAVSYSIVKEAARILPGSPEIVSLEPNLLSDILANIRLVGEKTGREQEAQELIQQLEERINFVVTKTSQILERPKAYCMEWLDPPFAAGHWVPEMVAMAGGKEGLGPLGQPSEQIEWKEVLDYAPEIIVLMPCGFNLTQTIQKSQQLRNLPGWSEIPAVKSGQVYAVDGSSYFNRPGPRIVTGLEILAQIIHPDLFAFDFPPDAYKRI